MALLGLVVWILVLGLAVGIFVLLVTFQSPEAFVDISITQLLAI